MTNEADKPGVPGWFWPILIGRKPKWTLARIVALIVACGVLFGFVLLPIRVEGLSMLPTYRPGRVNFVNRLAYRQHDPRRGDVVSIRLAGNSIMYMKRIVGLPGETVEFADGKLLVNGTHLDEPYVKSYCHWEMAPRKLGPDEYFVVGDNRGMPIDDHEHGAATRNRIVGKVLL